MSGGDEMTPLSATARQAILLDWSQLTPGLALRLAPALVVLLAGGLVLRDPAAGAIAASGAFIVGLGAFQESAGARADIMLFALFGMGASTFIGTLVGNGDATMVLSALVYGFCCGLLPAIGVGAFWVGQQCAVFLLIAGAYAGGLDHAFGRTVLVTAGGLLQLASHVAIVSLERGALSWPSLRAMLAEGTTALAGIGNRLRPGAPQFRFAVRFSLVLAAAVATERILAIPNGYWAAMTALLLMRPDFHDTLWRSVGRLFGTFGGATLATLIAHVLMPGPEMLAGLVAGNALLAYATLRLNYAVFSLFLTAYVVFLLVLAGLAESQVAAARIVATALGGAFALAAHLDFYLARRRTNRDGQAT
jgi:uncharacterized membrane protein YccC